MTLDDALQKILSFAGGGGLGAVLTYKLSKRKQSQDADAQLVQTSLAYTNSLVTRIEKLEKDYENLRKDSDAKLESLRQENLALHKEVAALSAKLSVCTTTPVTYLPAGGS